MHRSLKSWQSPSSFMPERWHRHQQPSSSANTSSSNRSSNSSSSSNSWSAATHSSSSFSSNQNAAPQTSSSTSNSNGSLHNLSSSNAGSASTTVNAQSHVRGKEASSPGAVPRQSVRPGSGSILSGMGPNGAYIPFGAGPRNCIGTGKLSAKLASFALLRL